MSRLVICVLLSFCGAVAMASETVEVAVQMVQHDWEVANYQSDTTEQNTRWEDLATKAHAVSANFPGRAEPLIWEGIALSSWAGHQGGLSALSLVKEAKTLFEKALAIDPDALDGSAYSSLGVLYYKVPGWPLGFGNNDKARELLETALTLNPRGIDPNYFYAEYLLEMGQTEQATLYLRRALAAPARAGRHIADTGRKEAIKALLSQLQSS